MINCQTPDDLWYCKLRSGTVDNILFRLLIETNCSPLGMESGTILDSQITASSEYGPGYAAHTGRLNVRVGETSWTTLVNDVNQWLQVDFLQNVTLSKLATQGRDNFPQWVESYMLSYSMDGNVFQTYKQCGEDKVRLALNSR